MIVTKCSTTSNTIVIMYCYIGCRDKASAWYLNAFPDGSNTGSTVVVVSHIQRIGCQPEKLLYLVANPARGLLNREKNKK